MKKLLSFLILSIFIITACSTSNNTAISSIKSVLTYQFTVPDLTLLSKMKINEEASYLEEIYSPHFTEDMYQKFIQDDGIKYHLAAYESGYNIIPINIDIVMDDNNIYDFILQVSVYDEDTENPDFITEVTGRTQISDDSKISNIEVYNDVELSEILHMT